MSTQGPFAFTVTEAQVVQAMRRMTARRMTRGPAGWLLIAIAVLLVLLVGLEVLVLGRVSRTAVAIVVAVPIALLLVHFWMVPLMGRRQYRQSVALREETEIGWDDEALRFSSSRGAARLPFGDFHRWDETGDLIMLYQTEMYFHIVPRIALGQAAPDLITRLAAAGVARA